MCDKIIIINNGRLMAYDTPDNIARVMEESKELYVTVKGDMDRVRESVEAISGISSVEYEPGENDSEIRMVIKTHDNLDVREQLFNKMALMNTPIIEMRYHEVSLEEIFLSLTKGGSNQNIRRKTLNKELKESVE